MKIVWGVGEVTTLLFIYCILLTDILVTGTTAFVLAGDVGWSVLSAGPIISLAVLYGYLVIAVLVSLYGKQGKFRMVLVYAAVRQQVGWSMTVLLIIGMVWGSVYRGLLSLVFLGSILGIIWENSISQQWNTQMLAAVDAEDARHRNKTAVDDYQNSPTLF